MHMLLHSLSSMSMYRLNIPSRSEVEMHVTTYETMAWTSNSNATFNNMDKNVMMNQQPLQF